ncbi:LOW QUALITY PROTEIN: squamous cell carcinoma antigen recognized by T-cells 3-like [Acanthaster planci]|uniref:LOW QUALITY PROTEIN: squamous cell carcinoma antigen recognized by T-cells 3-like n=1 Tax=Acanthaster planci TaxID=133434 RepID=A0A8B7YUR8_ACAPL|nr:LOW QUALITY PROTEIN: squamous cell carcinoma antigen recognized by T-cells 3-like [Acanthaster planci]
MANIIDEHVLQASQPDEMSEEAENEGDEGEEDMEEEDSGSSDDDDLEETAIKELESQVSSNPYEYNGHIELIKLLRRAGEWDRLCHAYQRMSDLFPLTAELWLGWIKDQSACTRLDGREEVYKLFERAVMDYVSPDVWLEYGQFSIGGIGTPEGIEKARSVFERAIAAVGLHVTRGSEVWEVYREFENALLRNWQTERVSAIFRRQLSVPLMDMEDTYKEYESWLSEPVSENVRKAYEKAFAQLKKREPHEQQLLKAEPPVFAVYQPYLEYERREGNPARIQCLYERALTDNCLQIELWKDYTKYLDSELKVKSVVLPVYARAVRNCPWSSELWIGYLVTMERYQEPHSTKPFEKALGAGFSSASEYLQLWQTHIDYLRRRIDWGSEHEEELSQLRATLEKAGEHLATYFGVDGDPVRSLQQYSARMEAKHCGNMEAARSQWNEIMALGHANEAQMWLEYVNLERSYGDAKHCRKILHRAVAAVSDYPECLFEALINFEREEGTFETWENALKRVETQMVRVSEMRSKQAAKDQQETVQESSRKPAGAKIKGNKGKQRGQDDRRQDRNVKAVKRKHSDEKPQKPVTFLAAGDSPKSQDGGEEVFKMPLPPPPPNKTASPVKSASSQPGPTPPKQAKTSIAPLKQAKEEEASGQSQPGVRWGPPPKQKPARDPSKDHLTIFVKNLSYETTEKQIRSLFVECGEITEVRMVENYRHQFRGYCYVEFQEESSVEKALKMDRQSVEGRPMYVDRSMDKSTTETKKTFQYAMKMEKNKLFVSGLPRSATAKQLQELFGQYGKIQNLRIVTYRSGVPKGLAYVDFEQESDAARAVVGADSTVMDGHTISVAISNPPARKPKKEDKEEAASEVAESPYPPKSLGAKGVVGPRGKGRTQLSLVPRALQRTPAPKTQQSPKTAGQREGVTSQVTEGKPQAQTTGKMSNADFAKMLLKK